MIFFPIIKNDNDDDVQFDEQIFHFFLSQAISFAYLAWMR